MTRDAANELIAASESALDAMNTAIEFLGHGTPIQNGSELHGDFVAYRDRLRKAVEAARGGV